MSSRRNAPAQRLENPVRTAAHEHYLLRLYVVGNTARSRRAIETIRAICESRLAGRYDLEVVDVRQMPERARAAQVVATPTLVKERPGPVRRLVGDLAVPERILLALDIVGDKGSSR